MRCGAHLDARDAHVHGEGRRHQRHDEAPRLAAARVERPQLARQPQAEVAHASCAP